MSAPPGFFVERAPGVYQYFTRVDKLVPSPQPYLPTPVSFSPTEQPVQVRPTAEISQANATLQFSINGQAITIENPSPKMKLVEFLRYHQGLVGTKKSCGEAGCGACTVMMTDPSGTSLSINSCIRPICSLNGMNITTIEGIGSLQNPHPISKTLAQDNGTQCGFCSPGMVMNMYSLLAQKVPLTPLAVQKQMDGNLCRCTGYRPILKTMCSFATATDEEAPPPPSDFRRVISGLSELFPATEPLPHVSTHSLARLVPRPLSFTSLEGIQYSQPANLQQLVAAINASPNWKSTMLMRGNTSLAIYKDWNPQIIIDVQNVAELNQIQPGANSLVLGGAVTINQLINTLESLLSSVSIGTKGKFERMLEHLHLVANNQVRNVGSIAGNLMMVHRYNFVSDLFIVLASANATLLVWSMGTLLPLSLQKFLTWDMTKSVLVSVSIPYALSGEFVRSFKVMQRHVNSHAIVNGGFNCVMSSGTLAAPPILCFAGVARQPAFYINTAISLVGQPLTSNTTLQTAMGVLAKEIQVVPAKGTNPNYRRSLVFSLFYKWYLSLVASLPPSLRSVVDPFVRPKSFGEQSFQTDKLEYPVSEPINKLEGLMQTTGTLPYTDDAPVPANCVHVAFVKSAHAKATLSGISWGEILLMPGVIGVMDGTSLPAAQNQVGPICPDEPLFTTGPIMYNGQAVGMVVADTQVHADEAAKTAQQFIAYSSVEDDTAILNLEAGISQASFFPPSPLQPTGGPVKRGDVAKGFADSQNVLSGTVACGYQYHFHMETQTHYAEPGENNSINMLSSNQWPQLVAQLVARTCAVPQNKVRVTVSRCGGGYGGKITRVNYPAVAVALAAQTFNRPAKIVMDLQDNMELLGKRSAVLCTYKIGFNNDGKIQALQVYFYQDGGAAYDWNQPNIGLMSQTVDNCYFIPNFHADGVTVRTNTPPNTACRGPGWLPATYIMESIMEQVALLLALDPWVVKELNFYKNGQVTPCGQKIQYFTMDKIWPQLKESAQLANRLKEIESFNSNNKWTKRGISMVPIKFGILSTGQSQSCLLNVFGDGTVQLSLSGIELGQGLNTKAVQVAAFQLGADLSLFSVANTSTSTNPNAISTGSSVTSEVVAGAVINACAAINAVLAPFKKQTPGAPWPDLVAAAMAAGANLSAKGWNNPPAGPDGPFNYESYSACVTEVELDVLTGQMQILRADILFDCGRSLSPWIDIGQVEGAFVMGLGYFATEAILYDQADGSLLTNGTWEYKPPSQLDIPIDFRIALLKNVPNPLGVMGSKAQGEPPLCLASSVLFALQHAVKAARTGLGLSPAGVQLSAPATVGAVQQAIGLTPALLTLSP